jgi:hypothetical protein
MLHKYSSVQKKNEGKKKMKSFQNILFNYKLISLQVSIVFSLFLYSSLIQIWIILEFNYFVTQGPFGFAISKCAI